MDNYTTNQSDISNIVRRGISIMITDKDAFAHEIVEVKNDAVSKLTPPAGANNAEIVLEQASAAGDSIVCRVWFDGTDPKSDEGIRMGDLDDLVLKGAENLRKFRIIQVETGTHKLFVQYFK